MNFLVTKYSGIFAVFMFTMKISTVPDQNGIPRLYNILEMHYSGAKLSKYNRNVLLALCFQQYITGTFAGVMYTKM